MSTLPRLDVRTVVVDGPIALQTRRLAAASSCELGLQVLTMEQLAAHLAGGFLRHASSQDLDDAVRSALDGGGFEDLHGLRSFSGAVRAVSRTLGRLWSADLPFGDLAQRSARMADLALIDERVRAALPCGSLIPPDLARAALQRVHLAGKLTGAIEFAHLPYVAPVWRELITSLSKHVEVRWSGPAPAGSDGMPGERLATRFCTLPTPDIVACSDYRGEALEAVRWARELLASGQALPQDIAIATADPRAWDDVMLAARAEARLPLCFSHGIPALETRNGQACATLADLLQHGLSQQRVRRVLAHCAADAPGLVRLPPKALLGVAKGAELSEVAHWRAALAAALPARTDGQDPAPALLPLLETAGIGLDAAPQAGRLFLPPAAYGLWADALRRAPCQALTITLQSLRTADRRHPGDCVTWGPARHLAASPRPFVRLLGLNARAWPRQAADDPILPAHVLDPSMLGVPPVAAQDRAAFTAIRDGATGALALSRTRRNPRGGTISPSPLLPSNLPEFTLVRQRIPRHACGPADRLLARPDEAATDEVVMAATACSLGRRSRRLNAHDGLLPADHPLVVRALQTEQSATSLRLLLRDPQGFVWRHVLHWRSPRVATKALTLDAHSHGELVHELLRDAVEALEAGPGYGRATSWQVREAVDIAARTALAAWPTRRPTPPRLLWTYAVDLAAKYAKRALERDLPLQPTTRSYTEVAFGTPRDHDGSKDRKTPWSSGLPVLVPGSGLRFGGSIDRLDIRGDGAVQVTDYKTGEIPKRYETMALDGGRELQRVLYALAARTLLPECRSIKARLAFLQRDPAALASLPEVDGTIDLAVRHLAGAAASLLQGASLPGPDADDEWADRRIALPALTSGYSTLKRPAFHEALKEVGRAWSAP